MDTNELPDRICTLPFLGRLNTEEFNDLYRRFAGICLECKGCAQRFQCSACGQAGSSTDVETRRFAIAYKLACATGDF